jgi:hypothetical protein
VWLLGEPCVQPTTSERKRRRMAQPGKGERGQPTAVAQFYWYASNAMLTRSDAMQETPAGLRDASKVLDQLGTRHFARSSVKRQSAAPSYHQGMMLDAAASSSSGQPNRTGGWSAAVPASVSSRGHVPKINR